MSDPKQPVLPEHTEPDASAPPTEASADAALPVEPAEPSATPVAPSDGGDDGAIEPDGAAAHDAADAATPAAGSDPSTASADAAVEAVAPGADADPADPAAPAHTAPPPDLSPAATAAALAERFAALFGAGRALPIKLRIQTDIQARAPGVFSRKALSIFLHRYTTSTPYLKALLASPQRFDLDGAPAGEVLPEHREAATVELDRRRAIVDARRAAERAAQQQRQRPRPTQAAAGSGPGAAVSSADAAGGDTAAPAMPGAQTAPQNQRPPGDRPPRPQRPQRQGRPDRPGRPGRPDLPDRPDRPAGPPHQQRSAASQPRQPSPAPRHDRPAFNSPAADAADAAPPHAGPAPVDRAPAPAGATAAPAPSFSPAEMEARRERATLLRNHETTTLTRANFCALKGITEAALDAQLVLARQEREQRGPDPRDQHREQSRDQHREQHRPQQRDPHRDPRSDRPERRSGKPPGR